MSYPPTLEVKRQMLTNAREQFRAKGFECELNIEALKAQVDGEDKGIETQVAQYELARDNAYKSARRMDEILAKLPQPKAERPKIVK